MVKSEGTQVRLREEEEKLERNSKRVIVLKCRYEGCGKICKLREGLTAH